MRIISHETYYYVGIAMPVIAFVFMSANVLIGLPVNRATLAFSSPSKNESSNPWIILMFSFFLIRLEFLLPVLGELYIFCAQIKIETLNDMLIMPFPREKRKIALEKVAWHFSYLA